MSNVSKDVFSSYYQALPSELQSLHMYFRAAKHYHKVHRPGSLTSMQKRRWAREELSGHVATEYGPPPILERRKDILAADREQRIARVRQRRPQAKPAPLRINLRGGWGEVVPFARTRQAAECPSELVAAQA